MTDFTLIAAKKIPATIRKHLLEERLIQKAVNIQEPNSPMEYLFDVYEEFVDIKGEHDDFTCGQCRQEVLLSMKKMLPYLEQLEKENYAV